MLRIRNGDLFNAGVLQTPPLFALQFASSAGRHKQHNSSKSVYGAGTAINEARISQLLWILDVGGEENVEWCAILNLRKNVSTRAINCFYLCAGLLLVSLGDFRQRRLEVGCRSHSNLLQLRRARLVGSERHGQENQFQSTIKQAIPFVIHRVPSCWSHSKNHYFC